MRKATASAILTGFKTAGFIYIRNHGIDRATVEEAFQYSAEFFKRPTIQKEQLAWTTAEANRGYVRQGREKTTDLVDAGEIERVRALEGADLKESLEIGREGVVGLENRWPDVFDEQGKVFREKMVSFFETCKKLHVQVMQAIAVGLGIEESWFDEFCDGGDNTLRLLHYPAVSSKVFAQNKNTVRAGAHPDYGEQREDGPNAAKLT
jgi:isopenicillin N synthase-like dioxygenase